MIKYATALRLGTAEAEQVHLGLLVSVPRPRSTEATAAAR